MTPVRLLVVTAVTAEREAAARGLDPAAATTEHTLPGHVLKRTGDGFAPGRCAPTCSPRASDRPPPRPPPARP